MEKQRRTKTTEAEALTPSVNKEQGFRQQLLLLWAAQTHGEASTSWRSLQMVFVARYVSWVCTTISVVLQLWCSSQPFAASFLHK